MAKRASPEVLEARRDLLLRPRVRRNQGAKQTPGYKTAVNLRNPFVRRSHLAGRVAVFAGRQFLVEILSRSSGASPLT